MARKSSKRRGKTGPSLAKRIRKWALGLELENLGVGTALTVAAMFINAALGGYLLWIGKKRQSVILRANGKHVLTDCWTSLGVIIGLGLVPAVIDAASDRLRPVLLTTLTTVIGLTPLLYEPSRQAQFLKPTVVTLIYGLGFGVVLVLLMVPALLAVQKDIERQVEAMRRALAHPRRGDLYVKRATKPQPIGDVLTGVLEDAGMLRQFERLGVLEAWPEIVGEQVAAVTRARSVEDTTLVVEVRSSAWLMELDMMKGDLVKRVNEHVPETPLARIAFVLAETE